MGASVRFRGLLGPEGQGYSPSATHWAPGAQPWVGFLSPWPSSCLVCPTGTAARVGEEPLPWPACPAPGVRLPWAICARRGHLGGDGKCSPQPWPQKPPLWQTDRWACEEMDTPWALTITQCQSPGCSCPGGWSEVLRIPPGADPSCLPVPSLPGWEPSQWRGHGEAVPAGTELLPAGVWEDVL